MGDLLGHKQEESKTRRAERERARPLLRAWFKAVDAMIRAKRLSEFHGRLSRKLTDFPSANFGKCWPGQGSLAKDLGKGKRTVWAGVKDMKREGLLIGKRGGPGKTATYWFAIDGKKLFDMDAKDLDKRGQVIDFPNRDRRRNNPQDSQKTANLDSQKTANLDSQKIANKPLEQVYPLEVQSPLPPEPTIATSGETARSGLPRKEANQIGESAVDGDILSPNQISFNDFWQASGMVGKIGPAMAAWNKLSQANQRTIAEIILRDGLIETGGTWASTWLNTQAWQLPAVPAAVDHEPTFTNTRSALFDWEPRAPIGPPMLEPYSEEWKEERARRVARREPVGLMDQWAQRGLGWPCFK